MKNPYRYFAFLALLVVLTFGASPALAQENPQPRQAQEVIVRIQQDAPKVAQAVAPEATKSVVEKANEWAQLGANMGTAVGSAAKAVLHETKDATFGKDVSVVDGIDKFSKTDAGRFTMLVVAWKVMGADAVNLLDRFTGVAVGIPLLSVFTLIYIWVIRRFFMPRTVLLSKTGGLFSSDRKVEYGVMNATANYKASEGVRIVSTIDPEERFVGLFLSSVIFILVGILITAQVIF